MSPTPSDKLLKDYLRYKVTAKEAFEILRAKSLADGVRYYFGFNTRDGWLEIFKTDDAVIEKMSRKSMVPARELSVEEVDKHLELKGLYVYASPAGWVTIRRVPKGAEQMPPMRDANEDTTL